MENDRDYHFALGHFCAGCKLSVVQHIGCPMVVTKNNQSETINKSEDKPQPVTDSNETVVSKVSI